MVIPFHLRSGLAQPTIDRNKLYNFIVMGGNIKARYYYVKGYTTFSGISIFVQDVRRE